MCFLVGKIELSLSSQQRDLCLLPQIFHVWFVVAQNLSGYSWLNTQRVGQQLFHQPFPPNFNRATRSRLAADAPTHLQETVISTLVAGMFPVIGSKSYTDDMSSNLSITSPSISSIARVRGGSGLIREAHSLAPTERVESPVIPGTRSETRRPPVQPGEAATSQMLKLERREGGSAEWADRGALVNCPCSTNQMFQNSIWDYCCALTELHITWRGGPLCALCLQRVSAPRSARGEKTRYPQTHPSSSHTELHSSAGNPALALQLSARNILCAVRVVAVWCWTLQLRRGGEMNGGILDFLPNPPAGNSQNKSYGARDG